MKNIYWCNKMIQKKFRKAMGYRRRDDRIIKAQASELLIVREKVKELEDRIRLLEG